MAVAVETLDEVDQFSDVANARKLAELADGGLWHTPQKGWFRFSGSRYELVHGDELKRWAMNELAPLRYREAEAAKEAYGPAGAKSWVTFSKRSASNAGLTAAIDILKADLTKDLSQFDQDPYVVACNDKKVDLRTGTVIPLTKADLITRNTGVNYNPHAMSDLWSNFLQTFTSGDAEVVNFLRHGAGLSLIGKHILDVYFVLKGPAGCGKSTFLEALFAALGSYASAVSPAMFFGKGEPSGFALNALNGRTSGFAGSSRLMVKQVPCLEI